MEALGQHHRPVVLVVDDDASTRLLAQASLTQGGFAVVQAEDGLQALSVFPDLQPDIVLLDVMMPGMDGFECCATLRRLPVGTHVPVLMITGLEDMDSVEHAYQAGATDFITKPINWVVLRHRMRYMLRASRAAAALRESEARLANAQRIAQLGNWDWHVDSDAFWCSAEVYRILGHRVGAVQACRETLLHAVHPDHRTQVTQAMEDAVRHCGPLSLDTIIVQPGGAQRTVHLQAEPTLDACGRPRGLTGTVQDVTERKQMEETLRESEQRYALAAAGANDGLWDWNLKANKVYFSARWAAMLGHAEQDIGDSPQEWLERVHPDEAVRVRAEISAHIEGRTPHFESEYRIRHKDGSYRWVLCRGLAVRDAQDGAYRMAGSQTDITRRKGAEEQLVYDAFHDALTGLPNRALFMDRLERSIKFAARHPGYLFAVLFFDLDRFKVVNDSLGHLVGDQLLIEVSHRLKRCLRVGDTVARLGGDEFTILFDDIKDVGTVTRTVERIQSELTLPFNLQGHELVTSASMGITLSTTGYEKADEVLRDADIAMYRAKARGKGRYEIFDTAMHAEAVAIWQLETDLRAAIEHHEFQVHYQPIVFLPTGNLAGFEALLRWQHPRRGLLYPDEFLSVAEETGLIVPIGRWVLWEACRQMRAWQDEWPVQPPLFVSVNLGNREFAQIDLIEQIDGALRETGFDPYYLRLEVTETVLIENTQTASAVLTRLRDRGIRLSIDDFGTGYSSLSYLHRFPFDTLKIDRSFIQRLGSSNDSLEVVRAVVTLAHNLGMKVVAEGHETSQQLDRLKELDCEYVQGYFFSKPLDRHAAAALLEAGIEGQPVGLSARSRAAVPSG